jgi:aminopeptidase N
MKKAWIVVAALAVLGGCKPQEMMSIEMEEVQVVDRKPGERPVYNESRPIEADLIHTRLELRFDWERQHVNGIAKLDFKPYYYPISEVELDAKGMDILNVAMNDSSKGVQKLEYSYDGEKLRVDLGRTFIETDTFQLEIIYTAKPNELSVEGSAAISEAKGLYFVNPTNENPYRPRQIWTQGETESNSCWFPTMDQPNEKMTQEFFVYCDTAMTSLSNGELVYSIDVGDGTRLDYWKQDLPHAPYLAMLAIGEYTVTEDFWRGIPVNYYVEPEYTENAALIFNHTPEMLEFYSKLLGVDYPWDKYSQVVVRDYVSGAMENTSAVIFGEFVYGDERSLTDDGNEDIVAHEMFHHWFGDLVTCESWANIPLNEAFATYGEYLWREYKYGRENADYHLYRDLVSYLREFNSGKSVDMIRYDYEDKEDMFDSHSYAKGGRILHMLRSFMGDPAFFKGLNIYLEDNAYGAAEIHHLRLAMEEALGRDLNWFFNQWFLDNGHPQLDIEYQWIDSTSTQRVIVKQTQNTIDFPIYRLPIEIDFYKDGQRVRKKAEIDSQTEILEFELSSKPDWVNFDSRKMLLCEKTENKTLNQWFMQLEQGPLFMDRWEAMQSIRAEADTMNMEQLIIKGMNDSFWKIRLEALEVLLELDTEKLDQLRDIVIGMAVEDQDNRVRAKAIEVLYDRFEYNNLDMYYDFSQNSSYYVAAAGFNGIYTFNPEDALQLGLREINHVLADYEMAILEAFAEQSSGEYFDFFARRVRSYGMRDAAQMCALFAEYLQLQEIVLMLDGALVLKEKAMMAEPWWLRFSAYRAIGSIKEELVSRDDEESAQALEKIEKMMAEIKASETHPRLTSIYKRY